MRTGPRANVACKSSCSADPIRKNTTVAANHYNHMALHPRLLLLPLLREMAVAARKIEGAVGTGGDIFGLIQLFYSIQVRFPSSFLTLVAILKFQYNLIRGNKLSAHSAPIYFLTTCFSNLPFSVPQSSRQIPSYPIPTIATPKPSRKRPAATAQRSADQ